MSLLPRLHDLLFIGLVCVLTTCVAPILSQAEETRVPGAADRAYVDDQGPKPSWQVGESASYFTGKYGTDVRTNTLYVPTSLRRLFDNGDVTLVVPYVSITSNCGVTVVSGVPLRTGGLCPSTTSTGTFPSRVTESGIGDVLLIGRYYLYTEREIGLLPSIMVSGRIKAPTADRDRGLGTGEWDEGGGIGLTKLLTDKLIGLADAGYTIIGKPEGVNLRNQWSYDVGLGYYFLPTLMGSVYYEEARALVPGFQNPRDVFMGLSWKVTQTVRVNTGVIKGLSNAAPEYGASVGASFRF